MPVYFVQAGEDGPVKIGFAGNVFARMSKMQADCPITLRLLAVKEGDRPVERQIHGDFAVHRIRGEWFTPAPDLLEFVSTLPMPVRNNRPPRQKSVFRPKGRQWSIAEIMEFAGGVVRLAGAAGVDHSTIYGWRRRGRVPVERARDISNALDLPLYEIRPDVWPAEVAAAD